MTSNEAYLALSQFLDRFWEVRKDEFNDDLPSLLGSMMLTTEGRPVDAALWLDWLECLPSTEAVDEKTGFDTMKCFLSKYVTKGQSETRDIGRLLEMIEDSFDEFWNEWLESIAYVLDKGA